MSNVENALDALERALGEYAANGGNIEEALHACSPKFIRTLLENLPVVAEPWKVVDMRNGEPTRLVRSSLTTRWRDFGYGPNWSDLATVQRASQGKRARPRWDAFVGADVISPPEFDEAGNSMPINWSTLEEAQSACDARLLAMGVVLL